MLLVLSISQSRTKGFLNTDTDTDIDTYTDTEYLDTISKNLSVRVLCWDNVYVYIYIYIYIYYTVAK